MDCKAEFDKEKEKEKKAHEDQQQKVKVTNTKQAAQLPPAFSELLEHETQKGTAMTIKTLSKQMDSLLNSMHSQGINYRYQQQQKKKENDIYFIYILNPLSSKKDIWD